MYCKTKSRSFWVLTKYRGHYEISENLLSLAYLFCRGLLGYLRMGIALTLQTVLAIFSKKFKNGLDKKDFFCYTTMRG